jgi:hypothetical protein
MNLRFLRRLAVLPILGLTATISMAQVTVSGYLCCNLKHGSLRGERVGSDMNWAEFTDMVPVGSQVRASTYISFRLNSSGAGGVPHKFTVTAGRTEVVLANDYSRQFTDKQFLERFIVEQDPRPKIATFSPEVQAAIAQARIAIGMTKEQVIISQGPVIPEYNPVEAANVWRRFWGSFDEYQIFFDKDDKVARVMGLPFVLKDVVYPKPAN